jgi:hypothetical protein
MTTLEQIEAARQGERETQVFAAQMEAFLNHYKPDDRREASEFERDLIMLIRQIYRDAQAPLLDQIIKLATATATIRLPT